MDREERLRKRQEWDKAHREAETPAEKAERLRLRKERYKEWRDVSALKRMSELQMEEALTRDRGRERNQTASHEGLSA